MRTRRLLALTLVWAVLLTLPALGAGPFTVEEGVLTAYTGPGGRVVVPEGVTALGEGVFAGREDITSAVLPAGVTDIGDRAFQGCSALGELVMLGEVTRFGAESFAGCVGFSSMAVPASVRELGAGAFRGCTALTAVVIPSTLTEFGMDCFGDTPFLVGLGRLAAVNGVLLHCGEDVIHMEVPQDVTVIAPGACAHRPRLTRVIIPAWVTEIGDYAFWDCPNLTDVYILGRETVISPTAFEGSPQVVLHGALDGAGAAYGSSHSLPVSEDLTLPEGELIQCYATAHTVWVDDTQVTFHMYALKNELGYETNYIRVRDLAVALMGTPGGYSVTWDGERIALESHTPYTPDGTEGDTPFSGDMPCRHPKAATTVDGRETLVDAILLLDDNGSGYTYYQLRELGQLLGFNVGWSPQQGVFVQTDRGYTPLD